MATEFQLPQAFSSLQIGVCARRKAHMLSTLSLKSSASAAFEPVAVFIWFTMAVSCPFKADQFRLHFACCSWSPSENMCIKRCDFRIPSPSASMLSRKGDESVGRGLCDSSQCMPGVACSFCVVLFQFGSLQTVIELVAAAVSHPNLMNLHVNDAKIQDMDIKGKS